MAAADNRDDHWLELQQRRVERMRFEVLYMLYDAASHCVDLPVDVGGFVKSLGVWEDQLSTVLQYLHEQEYINYERVSDSVNVCLTIKGVDYIEKDRGRRSTIRD